MEDDGALARSKFNGIVWPFAISQTISWAAMFYIFPAMFNEWAVEFDWSKTQISGALTLCLVVSAISAPIAGRIIDRGHFVALHFGGTLLGIILLLALSQLHTLWQFYAVWGVMGLAMACVLYEPCFAILTRTFDTRARAAILRVTLVAGLAGTLAFPAVHYLTGEFGWRMSVEIIAGAMVILSLPFAWMASYRAEQNMKAIDNAPTQAPRKVMRIMRTFTFWLLAVSYVVFALDHAMIITHILPLLNERGVTPQNAVLAATFIGPMQVAGRIVMMWFENILATITIAAFALLALAISALSLLYAEFWPGLIVIFVVLQGAGNGVSSIVRPLLTGELLGRRNFGMISGVMALPFIGGFAAGPSISAVLWQWGGYDTVLIFAIAISLIGIATLLAAARLAKNQSQ